MTLRYVFSELRQGLQRNFSMHVAVVLTLFVSLTLVGLGFLLNSQAKKAEEWFGSQLQITVFLCNGQPGEVGVGCSGAITDPERKAIIKKVEDNPLVADYHTETKQEAFEKTKELLGGEAPVSSAKYMRDSIWVDLKDAEDYQAVAEELQFLDGVHGIRSAKQILDPIYSAIDALKYGAIGIAVFLIVAALLLVANTIRLAAYARRREIGIMRLVGASSLYISLPFLMEAVVTAIVGVVLAGGALAAFTHFAINQGVSEKIVFMPWVDWPEYFQAMGWVAIIGPALTLIPTLLLTRKYLKV